MIKRLFEALVILAAVAAPARAEGIEGCYVSREYAAGVHDLLKIERVANNRYLFKFILAACDYPRDPDCKGVHITVSELVMKKAKIEFVPLEASECRLGAALRRDGRLAVWQAQECGLLPYFGAHGLYSREQRDAVLGSSCD